MPNALAKKTGIKLMIVHFHFRRKLDIIRCYAQFFSMVIMHRSDTEIKDFTMKRFKFNQDLGWG